MPDHREERLAADCRAAKEILGTTQATWITFPVIKAKEADSGTR